MLKLIVGKKGSGKTKTLIDHINAAAAASKGNVVCVEKGPVMTYSISHKIRLVDIEHYDVSGYDALYGFLTGILAGNYDITHMFIDNLCKTVGRDVDKDTEGFIRWLDSFGERNGIKFTVTISANPSVLSEDMQRYL